MSRLKVGLAQLALAAFSLGCPSQVASPDVEAAEVGLGLPAQVAATSCEEVDVQATIDGPLSDLQWSVEGLPLLLLVEAEAGKVVFRAPSVTHMTEFSLHVVGSGPDGAQVQATVVVSVSPRPADEALAAGMARGCAPFEHGVASGDPDGQSVLIWTRVSPDASEADVTLSWKVATDAMLTQVVGEGDAVASASADFTLAVLVEGLESSTTYYYAFWDAKGRPSVLGRTRTAPVGDSDHLRFAVASCSSIFSGYFNAYGRIAEREDLDAVIHLGDYIYDFVDEDEEVRLPATYPTVPRNLKEWRERHAYYLADPNLRMARAMHPWIVIWDNHDVEDKPDEAYDGSTQAFAEWVPMRALQASQGLAYRHISYGSLLDIVMLDVLLHRNEEKVPESDELSILGDVQWDWLQEVLTDSSATWRLIGSQKVLGTVRVDPAFRDGSGYFDLKTWDGFPADRHRLLTLLGGATAGNNVVLSGDSHVSIALDLVDDPTDPSQPYDPRTSDASVGVELLPTSISRGNFDEQLGDNPELFDYLATETMALNPHHRYLELTKHGYGIIDVRPERVVGEIWYSEILEPTDVESLGLSLKVEAGTQKWSFPGDN